MTGCQSTLNDVINSVNHVHVLYTIMPYESMKITTWFIKILNAIKKELLTAAVASSL